MEPLPSGVSRRCFLLGGASLLTGCAVTPTQSSGPPANAPSPAASASPPAASTTPDPPQQGPADAATMLTRATVPVLCYHQIRDWASGDSGYSKQVLICPPAHFRRQLDGLKDAGHTTISPGDYLAHLQHGTPLPPKPVILTFDDGKDSQPLVAGPELTKRGMQGTFFVMSVVIGKKGWIAPDQIRQLADAGHTIGSHTYDHHDVRKYAGDDWKIQLADARATLQKHSGQPVETFAYPYGAWNPAALPHLTEAGYTTAFQLKDQPIDPAAPALTLRRVLVASAWDGDAVVKTVSSPV